MAGKSASHHLIPALLDESRSLAAQMAGVDEQVAGLQDFKNDLEARKNKVDSLIADLKSSVSALLPTMPATPKTTAKKPRRSARASSPPKSMPPESPYYGKALPEAAMHRLFLIGKPESKQQIWNALVSEGYPSDSNRPVNAVHWALQRRAKKHGDVLLVEPGKWGLRAWYTPDQLDYFARNIGGMGGRDREEHVEKTKQAIANLKARGVPWGRPSKLTPDGLALFFQKRAEGATWKDAAAAVGVAVATIKYHLDKIGWKTGDPPPIVVKTVEEKDSETELFNTEASETVTEEKEPETTPRHLRVVGQN